MERIPYLGETIIRWQVGNSTFLAHPERGARLMNWHLTLGDGTVRDVLFWPEATEFDGFHKVRGGNPILFPFAGPTFDGDAKHHWKAADGIRRPMPMHGIARQGRFRITRLDGKGFAAQFEPDAAARESYPFDYEFVVTYRFEPLAVSCEFTLRNLGTTPIPWAPSHHFYFTLPWSEGTTRSDYLLRIPATLRHRLAKDGTLEPLLGGGTDCEFSDPGIVDVVHGGLKRNEVAFGEKDRPGDILIRIGGARKPTPDACIVTWTESAKSPFYCVEPCMAPPNAAGRGAGLAQVPPGGTSSWVNTVEVR
jgi:galactose mutarotase-like enzyme